MPWQPGMQVRLISSPLRIGMLTDAEPRERNNRRLFQVRFPDIVERVYEDKLEPLTEERMNPLDLLADGRLGTHHDLRRTLTHVRLTGRLADLIYSMEATNTDFYAYQFKPVLKLLQTPTNGLLIADEVGLGKTIEAGLIWTELRSRFNMKRFFVLCPAALREKWRDELADRFGLSPVICDAAEALNIMSDSQAQARGFAVISSMQGLRPPREREEPTSGAGRLARFLDTAIEDDERLVDLLVVDEAHHMRNPKTRTRQLGELMRGVSEYLVLLTATPIHNRNRDLFSLLHILDPDTFRHPDDLEEILYANAPLVRARDSVLRGTATAGELRTTLSEAQNTPLLHGNRQLQALLDEITEDGLASASERSRIAYRLETVNLLGHAVTRTRKRDVQEWRVVREPKPEFVPMTEIERKFYDLVTEVVIDYCMESGSGINQAFLLVMPQRQVASCMPAALKSWRERNIDVPDDELSWVSEDDREQLGPLTARLAERSDEFPDFDELAANDSKYACLRPMLRDFFQQHPQDKVIVFSTFRGTLAYLAGRLHGDGISSIILQGGGSRSKKDVIDEFRSPEGPNVLLSSEVGGEGVDLQFSWVVINYDLPWNPMRVEQRIGRVDRLDQKSEIILIWNLFYADTVDARIYERLYDKLDLCRNAMGDFEAILGQHVNELTRDLFAGRLTAEQQDARISQTAQALETLKHEEERLEAEAAHLVAYGDYILQQVHAAREMNRRINGTDLFTYVTDFLNTRYPGYEIIEIDAETYRYELSLSTEAKHGLSEFVRREKLTGQTRLIQNATTPVACRFENRVLPGMPSSEEIVSQFHPLVRFVSARISETAAQIRPAVSIQLSAQDINPVIEPGIYILAVSLWSVQGLRDVERLVYEAVSLHARDRFLGTDDAERLAAACVSKGRRWLEVKSECDLQDACRTANERLFGSLDERFKRYVDEESDRNEDRADIQERNLEHRVSNQRETILGVIEKHRSEGRTRLIPANEGRLKTLEEKSERRKLEINSRRQVTAKSEEICVAVVQVE